MTKPRFLNYMTLAPRFKFSEDQWETIEATLGVDALSQQDRSEIQWCVTMFLQAATRYWGGIKQVALRHHVDEAMLALEKLAGFFDDEGTGHQRALKRAFLAQIQCAMKTPRDELEPKEAAAPVYDRLQELRTVLDDVGGLVDNPCWEVAETPVECFKDFAQNMQGYYETRFGQATARKDYDATEAPSRFVRFFHAVWIALPGMNRKSKAIGSMSVRLASVLMPPKAPDKS